MFKIFRQTRKTLMEKGKTGKYLKYAFGEIALVMIGILLALQVNNWNEDRKNKRTEKRYINQIIDDLKQDSLNLIILMKNSNEQIRSKTLLLDYLDNQESFQDSLLIHFNNQWQNGFTFTPTTRTIDEITATGNFDVIQNLEIRDLLLHIYNVYDNQLLEAIANYDMLLKSRLEMFYNEIPNLYDLTDNEILKTLLDYKVENAIRGNSAFTTNSALAITIEENSQVLKRIRESR